jgi:hypothetical protein
MIMAEVDRRRRGEIKNKKIKIDIKKLNYKIAHHLICFQKLNVGFFCPNIQGV